MSGTADFFYREAMRLGYVARSAFKLLQMQKQYSLITPGASVLDLGCAPGAWLQVACQHLGPLEKGGAVVGVDVKKVKVPSSHCDKRVRTVCANVMHLPKDQARELSPEGKGFSIVLSDMCPSISGIATKDAALSCELGIRALSLALGKVDLPDLESSYAICLDDGGGDSNCSDQNGSGNGVLRTGGNIVIKLLESEDIQGQISLSCCLTVAGLGKFCKTRFRKVSWLRTKATRSSSREIYLICQGLRRA